MQTRRPTDRVADPARQALRGYLTEVLALLRAQRWNYQTCHWQVHGNAYYGDHLLFERLYNNLGQEVDTLAEKVVGLLGDPAEGIYPFSNESQVDKATEWLRSWSIYTCPHRRSLRSEQDLQKALKSVYDILKRLDVLTLGLDDFLMSLANDHESHIYLLRQRIARRDMDRLASSRLRLAWFSLEAKGVERREQDPDYRAYVKRKRDKGEKALNRKEWGDWVEGIDRPDTRQKFDDRPDTRQKFDETEVSKDGPDEKPHPKKKKPEEARPEESPEDLKAEQDKAKGKAEDVSEHDQALIDEYLGKSKSSIRQRIVGLANKLKNREVVKWLSEVDKMTDKELDSQVEDLKKKMFPKVEEEMQEEVEAKGSTEISDLIPDEKTKRQFAENLAKNLPPEVAKGRPSSFLAFAIEHILDSMLEFAGKPEGTETAMEKRKRYQEYSKKHDQAKIKLEDQQTQLNEANKDWDEATKALEQAKKDLAEAEKKLDPEDDKLRKLKDKVEEGGRDVSDAHNRSRTLTKSLQDSVKEISRLTEDYAQAGPSGEAEREVVESERAREDKEIERGHKKEKREKPKKAGLRLLFSTEESEVESGEEESEVGDEVPAQADFGEFFDELARKLIKPDEEVIEKSLQKMVDEQGKKAAQDFRRLWFASHPINPLTAESYFFDNPERREVKQFHDSGALSNIIPAERAKGPPPTKKDIKRMPGGRQFSTLTRYVVETDEPGITGVPRGREELPKHPRLAGWTFAPRR